MYRRILSASHSLLLGVLPRRQRLAYMHWCMNGYWPNIKRPATFNEKMTARKIGREDPRWALTADKLRVREFVAERIGTGFLTALLGTFDRAVTIRLDDLPNRFVVKATHGSGWVMLVPDAAALDHLKLRLQCHDWLTRIYPPEMGEDWYAKIKPRIIIEEYLGSGAQPPPDFKFFVCRGEPVMVQVDSGRFTDHQRNLYRPDWSPIDCTLRYPAGPLIPPPPSLESMLAVASRLGSDFSFVRVDLYDLGDRVVFGELTHCPNSGWDRFSDPTIDRWLGSLIRDE